jgi:hypothetical protein
MKNRSRWPSGADVGLATRLQRFPLSFVGYRSRPVGHSVGWMDARALSIGVGVSPKVCSVCVESTTNGRVHW